MIWTVLNGLTVYIFGVILTFSYLGVERNKRNIALLTSFSAVLLLAQLALGIITGDFDMVRKLYPLIVHLPLYLLAVHFYDYSPIEVLTAILVAYSMTMPRFWLGDLTAYLLGDGGLAEEAMVFCTIPLMYLLLRFFSPVVRRAIRQPRNQVMIIGLPALTYYIISYGVTVYTDALYHLSYSTFELMLSIFSLAYFLLISIYFKLLFKNETLEKNQQLLSLLTDTINHQLESMKYSQDLARTFRHDMRHHFQMIDNFITAEDMENLQKYVGALRTEIAATVIQKYCANEAVNLILSSFSSLAGEKGIRLVITANIPDSIAIPDVDICTLLSNGLENAIHAVEHTKNPWIQVDCNLYKGKLVIQIKNPYLGDIHFRHGIPQSSQPGHGIGAFSIKAITEKYGGVYSFEADDGVFVLRVIL